MSFTREHTMPSLHSTARRNSSIIISFHFVTIILIILYQTQLNPIYRRPKLLSIGKIVAHKMTIYVTKLITKLYILWTMFHFCESVIVKRSLSFLVFSMTKMLFPLLISCVFLIIKAAYYVCLLVPRQHESHIVGIVLLWGFPRF